MQLVIFKNVKWDSRFKKCLRFKVNEDKLPHDCNEVTANWELIDNEFKCNERAIEKDDCIDWTYSWNNETGKCSKRFKKIDKEGNTNYKSQYDNSTSCNGKWHYEKVMVIVLAKMVRS